MSASGLAATGRASSPVGTVWRGAGLLIGTLTFGAVAGLLAAAGHYPDALGLALVLLPVMLWKRPQLGPVVILVAALLIEQVTELIEPTFGNTPGFGHIALVAHIPITNSIPLFGGLGSTHIEPADLLLFVVLVIYLMRGVEWGPLTWPRSPLAGAIATFMGFVFYGLVIGQMHHGALRESFQEIRPFFYLAAAYVLTAVLIRTRTAFRTMLWAYVISEAIKALQGLYVYIETRSWRPRPDAVLSHEEAYFFSIYILLVAALWLFGVRGRLRTVATWLLPLIIFVDLVNNRRAAWLVLGGGLLVLVATAYVHLPPRRVLIRKLAVLTVAFAAVYIPAFWNSSGTLGQPVTAIKSEFEPNVRDASSDLYREQEDQNLVFNIKSDGLLGAGFGVPIDYALPIVNIRTADPGLDYIPHNGVLYILMRLGLLGAVAFWGMLAAGISAACRLAKTVEREIAAVSAVTAAALVGYALEGATDQGFYFYRIALVTGCLLGLVEAGRRILTPSGAQRD